MNKYKKLAFAAVSLVMAGTMVFSMAACTPEDDHKHVDADNNGVCDECGETIGSGNNGGGNDEDRPEKPTLAADLTPSVDENDWPSYASGTTLSLDIGNNGTSWQDIQFQAHELGGTVTLPDGKTYNPGDLKPAWQALQSTLDMTFVNNYQNKSSNAQVTDPINGTGITIDKVDIITASLAAINENSDNFLNLNDYLYYMPNYYRFLLENPVTRWSLTGVASGTLEGAMYAAPYFDGNNDFENYVLAKHEWAEALLDNVVTSANDTYAAQATAKGLSLGASSAVTSYMGTTGKWSVDTTDPADGTKSVKLVVNYDAALAAAKDASTDLGKAIQEAAGSVYNGTSGNIVDLHNYALNAKAGAVNGNQLSAILRAYIDVAYQTEAGAKFYATRSDVFNSASAGWDVDLYVAMMRCVVTGRGAFDAGTQAQGLELLYGLMARQGTTQRRVNLYGLAGELYGIRGMGSRYEYTYINSEGKMVDARQDAESYDLVARMGALAKEGLIYTGDAGASGKSSYANGQQQAYSSYDYTQTQTQAALKGEVGSDYNYGPIVTPVSVWDTDDDGTHETIMRFTESWRSVKNTGFCVPLAAVRGNADKLAAVLTFIDYMFSTDGQILMTYGEAASSATASDGWWKGSVASGVTLEQVADVYNEGYGNVPTQYKIKDEYKQQYFVYKGKVYTGFPYAGAVVPELTEANSSFYLGGEVNGYKQASGNVSVSAVGSYTDYARKIIGTTLPIGNKNQGFEYQASAQCAIDGANNLTTCELNGTVKHVVLSLAEGQNPWYLIAPTAIPLSANDRAALSNDTQTKLSGTYFLNSSSTTQRVNVYLDLLFYGFDTSKNICGITSEGALKANGAAYVSWLNANGLSDRTAIFNVSWTLLNRLYKIVK